MAKLMCNKCGLVFTDCKPPKECPFCKSVTASYIKIKEDNRQTIPSYWDDELATKISKIRNHQMEAGADSVSFGLITDIHWCDNAHHSAALLKEVLHKCSVPYFFNAGDIVSGFGICDKDFLFEELDSYREAFRDIEQNCLMVLGNHDAAYSTLEAPNYYAENLSFEEIYEYMFRYQTLYCDRVFGPGKLYYYVDDTYHKMRYIVLDTHDVPSEEKDEKGLPVYNKFRVEVFGQTQLEWLAHTALNVPDSDWTVTLSSHETIVNGWKIGGSELVLGILSAFKNHTMFEGTEEVEDIGVKLSISADYTKKGGNFTAWVSGHTHCDYIENHNGIICVATLNDSMHKSAKSDFEKSRGTTSEQAFDIFTVDKKSRKVYITRIGAGKDREFDY